MHKSRSFTMERTIVSSRNCLALLAIVGLTMLSHSVHTSTIDTQQALPGIRPDSAAEALFPNDVGKKTNEIQSPSLVDSFESNSQKQINHKQATSDDAESTISRWRRSGRSFGGSSTGASSVQQPIGSYASALAAVDSAEQAAAAAQQQSIDSSAYNTFGESLAQQSSIVPPSSSSSSSSSLALTSNSNSPASVARQLSALSGMNNLAQQADYSAAPSSSNYYASSNSMSPSEAATYGSPMASNYHAASYQQTPLHYHSSHHDRYGPPLSSYQSQHQHNYYKSNAALPPIGYPSNAFASSSPSTNYYDRMGHATASHSSFWPLSSFSSFPSHGGSLISGASHALSHLTNGFTIGEIICGVIAISIGAIILGAPFFLIYLALMGNFTGSGTLSLTNPTAAGGAAAAGGGAATGANGRLKRSAMSEPSLSFNDHELARRHLHVSSLADSFFSELSPLIDLQQVSETFKHLVRSIEKYSNMKDEVNGGANKASKSFQS